MAAPPGRRPHGPEIPIAPGSELQCTRTGQVLSDLKGVSVFDLNAERPRELQPGRPEFRRSATTNQLRAGIKDLLGLRGWSPSPKPDQVVDERRGEGFRVRKLVIAPEPGIVIPAVDLVPDWPSASVPVLVKLGVDRAGEQARGGPVEGLVRGGRRVVLADLRGMGETCPQAEPGERQSPLGADVKEAFISLYIGRPLLSQRVMDLLCLLQSLGSEPDLAVTAGFEVTGTGAAGPVVLHSAALDEQGLIRRVVLEQSLVSWADVVERGITRDQLGSAVPGVLKFYDLPDLAARLEPCPLEIRYPTNAVGQPVSQSELEAAYSPVIQAFGTGGELVLRAGP